MTDRITAAIASQFDAALAMLSDCIERCPDGHWDVPIAKYPFWQVAYHTLCFVDLYLTPGGEGAFSPRPEFHPAGWGDYDWEHPSRRFDKAEIARYLDVCRDKLHAALGAETAESLAAPCGHSRRDFSRLELYVYNLRHVMHHTGQLSASVRAAGQDPRWVSVGRAGARGAGR